jgi:hypothetical protein
LAALALLRGLDDQGVGRFERHGSGDYAVAAVVEPTGGEG